VPSAPTPRERAIRALYGPDYDLANVEPDPVTEAIESAIVAAVEVEREREERMEEALTIIKNWCEAYSIEVFPKPDLKAAREKLGDSLMATLHAYWARHLLEGIAQHARRGLQNDELAIPPAERGDA
jgi:hypothetical protein